MNPADPRLTAYADGVLSPQDSLRFERELAEDPAALAELDDIRALQQGLREAFAGGPAVAWGRLPMRVAPRVRRFRFRNLVVPLLAAICLGLVAGAYTVSEIGMAREKARRSIDAANLRQIGLACRVFASAHDQRLPVAPNVWDFARQLAIGGGLTDSSVWLTEAESAVPANWNGGAVLAADGRRLSPAFANIRPSFAVLLSGLPADASGKTPIAWTRGLRADGTWAPDSPYAGDGGYVVFLDGSLVFYRRLDGLPRFDGKGTTGNIAEALPAGARIGEAPSASAAN